MLRQRITRFFLTSLPILALPTFLVPLPAAATSLKETMAKVSYANQSAAAAVLPILGTTMFYDPAQDLAGGIEGAAYGPGDKAWVEAALAVYDLYCQIGGEPPSRRFLFRRDEGRVFFAAEGSAGQWYGSVERGQAGFLKHLVSASARLPDALRRAPMDISPASLAEWVRNPTGDDDEVIFLGAGENREITFPSAAFAVGTAGLIVTSDSTAGTGVTATVKAGPSQSDGPQSVIAFGPGQHFTPAEHIDVSLSSAKAPASTVIRENRPQPSPVTKKAPVADVIAKSGEIRRFTVTVPSSGAYVITSVGPSDVTARLIGPDGTVLAADDDGGSGYNFRLSKSLEAGEYRLDVQHCCAGTGPFEIQLTEK